MLVQPKPKTTKTPTLRFPEFSGEWEEKRLGEILSIIVDNRGKTPPISIKGIPLIEVNALGDKCIDYGKISKFVDLNTFKTWFRKYLQRYDVLFSTVGQTAMCSIYNDEKQAVVAQNIVGLRFKDQYKDFPYYLITYKPNNRKFKRIEMVAVQPSVKVSQMVNLKFLIPSKEEQRKIASFLTTVDDWIENLKKQKEALEEYKKGMLQKLFSQEIRFKDENGEDYLEWEEKRLGEVCEYKNGNSFEMNVVDNGKYKLITLNSIDIDGNIKKEHKTVNYADWYLEKNDLVMVLSDVAHGDFLGLVDIIPENNKFVLNQRMGLLRKKSQSTDLRFLKFFINFNQRYFKLHGQGSSQQNLSKGDIEKFIITTPVLNEQNKITSFLSSIDDLINLSNQRITLAEEWKKGLMQGMFV